VSIGHLAASAAGAQVNESSTVQAPGTGTSHGNAGVLAACAVHRSTAKTPALKLPKAPRCCLNPDVPL